MLLAEGVICLYYEESKGFIRPLEEVLESLSKFTPVKARMGCGAVDRLILSINNAFAILLEVKIPNRISL